MPLQSIFKPKRFDGRLVKFTIRILPLALDQPEHGGDLQLGCDAGQHLLPGDLLHRDQIARADALLDDIAGRESRSSTHSLTSSLK